MHLIFALILFTTVMPEHWKAVSVPTVANLRGLSAVTGDIVWASGSNGTVLRTIDGGKNWSVTAIRDAETLDFRGIHAFDAVSAVVISSGKAEDGQARIYRTSDSGATWTLAYQDRTPGIFFDAIAFWDRLHGIVLSDPVEGSFVLFTTDDGGASWKRMSANLPPVLPHEGAFAASNSCLTVQGDSNVWFGTGGANVARVFRSKDRGQTWTAAETPIRPANASSGIFSLAFHDERRGVAVGGDYTRPVDSPAPNVVFTIDGGQTWSTGGATDPPGLYLSSVTYKPDSGSTVPSSTGALVAVGTGGANAADPGDRWTSDGRHNFNAVAFPVFNAGWAVGPKGTVARWSTIAAYTWATGENPYVLLQIARQAVVVIAPDWNSVNATLTRYERSNGGWRAVGEPVPVVVGRNGLAWDPGLAHGAGTAQSPKREGDGRAPAGIFPLRQLFGFSEISPNPKMPYHLVRNDTECVDDAASFSYNRILDRDQLAVPEWNSAEHMRQVEGYQEGVVVGYNGSMMPVSAYGSCIFLHVWDESKAGTAGCTAMQSDKLGELVRWLDSSMSPVLIQLPEAEDKRIKEQWHWPLP